MPSLPDILPIAKTIAQSASELILHCYHQPQTITVTAKGTGEGEVTTADLWANQFILEQLQTAFGTEEFAYVSEESADDPQRLHYEWVWIIDPLDGTKGFIDRSGEFSVHIGLVHGQRPVLGIVAMPAQKQLYWAIAGEGAYMESAGRTQRIQVSQTTSLPQMTAIISRSHRHQAMADLLARLPKQAEINVGSLGGKWMAIATGKADYYLTIPSTSAPKDWDFCAPEIILQEAGGIATYFDGSPIRYNRPDLNQTQPIIASNGHAHQELVKLCQEYTNFNQT